jgi:Ras GTPase-activating-like protein IQGAP2/3
LSKSIPHLVDTRFFLQPLTTACLKPVLAPFLQQILTMHVMRVSEAVELDLSTDPLEVS